MQRICLATVCALALAVVPLAAQDRATKVRQDKAQLAADATWIYNDLDRATAEARRSGRPLFVVLRCIPCEACSQFDQQLLARDNEVRDLFDRFVCVRIVQANGLDLSLFQFDYDQSFHALFLNADRTVYGRFGTRSARPEQADMTLAGLRQAMLAALQLHARYPANKAQLAGKQPRPVDVPVPEALPGLAGKYGPKLDYEGQLVQSCIHCHQIRDAERVAFRERHDKLPDAVLFPYPLPDVLGLAMNPDRCATIAAVAAGSIAAEAGLRPGDELRTLAGQPLVSTADLQWVLHNLPAEHSLLAQIRRDGQTRAVVLPLAAGWRRQCDISWRPTTWDLRRMATGGLVLVDLADDERKERGLARDALALLIKHVGQYGEHAAAKRAGFQEGDVLLQFGERSERLSESQFIAAALAHPRGTRVPVQVLRGPQRLPLELPLQ